MKQSIINTFITTFVLVTYSTVQVDNAAIKYDQRQEGGINVRADLENFVVLIIPTSSSSGLSLLDLIAKAIPKKQINKHHADSNKKNHTNIRTQSTETRPDVDDELQHFIESKSVAPYRVDISRTRSHLAKLHPQLPSLEPVDEAILISPTVQLARENENAVNKDEIVAVERFKKAIIQVPDEFYMPENSGEKFQQQPIPISEPTTDENQQVILDTNSNEELTESAIQVQKPKREELMLIGATEQCGPGASRDEQGICRYNADY